MKTKREDPRRRRAARRRQATSATLPRRHRPDADAPALWADGDDAALALPPMFEIAELDVPALEGAIDDWAGMDDWPDMIDEPADADRWR